MKTVNFLEALEANKTRRVRFSKDGFSFFGVGQFRTFAEKKTYCLKDFESEFIVEPDKIEFECKWGVDDKQGPYPIQPQLLLEEKLISIAYEGKKTKVTIEVID